MRKYLFGIQKQKYKANLHLHTTVSDGEMTPQEAKREYMKKGYSILAFTDHAVLVPHNDLSDENFLAITAYEEAVNEHIKEATFSFLKTYHLNFYATNCDASISPCFSEKRVWIAQSLPYITNEMKQIDYNAEYSIDSINDMLKKAQEAGFLVSLNHPVWSQQSYPDYIDLEGLWGIEVYNTACDLSGLTDTMQPYDDLLKVGKNVVPIAADDAHRLSGAFGGFTVIEADNLTYDEIISAMKQGDLYSSTGPQIFSIYLEGNKLTVECSPVATVALNTERRWAKRVSGNHLTCVEFDLTDYFNANLAFKNRNRSFIRLTLIDEKGKSAWTRAYFEEELKEN